MNQYQQIEKFPGCVRNSGKTQLFFPDEVSPRPEKPGFPPVRHVCPATVRKLFDLLNMATIGLCPILEHHLKNHQTN
ncbi:Uncharacterized protein dnm_024610 [Desulfonema magnum]|uniref:Uncharacterized protein n=1 Tax=Desulfonema magnum TaxID=45655 RepID=A0A975BJ02_9BACT|nr:Uncharacterized protein dnm_024610 [Desulfonema magnum]